MKPTISKRIIPALGALALLSSETFAQGGKSCFLSLERPLDDHASWSASCGSGPGVSGNAVDRLDQLPPCTSGHLPSCYGDSGRPIKLDSVLTSAVPVELSAAPPNCVPSPRPQWVRIGFVDFHRSCFRGFSDADRAELLRWAGSVPTFPPQTCDLNKFGELGVDRAGNSLRSPEAQTWANTFSQEYPPTSSNSLGTPAESIYAAFRMVREVNDRCLEALNPALADRMREAMGVQFRSASLPAGIQYRPAIDCKEQLALECFADQPECDRAAERLQRLYAERDDNFEEAYQAFRRRVDCRPAHAPGTMLGSTAAGNLVSGGVVNGSPRITLYSPTAHFSKTRTGGPATLFHEFLHAAGAGQAPGHNDGFLANRLPSGDQVYACEAIAFRHFFEKLLPSELRQACLECAAGNPSAQALCRRNDITRALDSIGCRLR